MAKNPQHHKINYIEFTTPNIEGVKTFYTTVFGWSFKDWGPDYIDSSVESAGLALGFARDEAPNPKSAPVAVLYSADLKATEAAIVAAGGTITVPTFEFPGGRRFHFNDGLGNVLAVWGE
ncbi:VOC family protein [Telmatobacter bradus]|uniref:VOC family protein n=1 Tax=Telmatobacter bradus TaxID=474953 RepID=UPI003B434014